MKAKRVFLIVLDSVGIGYAPDAADFGDHGADTMRRISSSEKFNIPNLLSLGLGNIDGVDYLGKTEKPLAAAEHLVINLLLPVISAFNKNGVVVYFNNTAAFKVTVIVEALH